MHTYTAILPDGTEFTRTTQRTYTHVIAVRQGEKWGNMGCIGRADLAQKKINEATSGRYGRFDEARAIPLTLKTK